MSLWGVCLLQQQMYGLRERESERERERKREREKERKREREKERSPPHSVHPRGLKCTPQAIAALAEPTKHTCDMHAQREERRDSVSPNAFRERERERERREREREKESKKARKQESKKGRKKKREGNWEAPRTVYTREA